MEKSNHVEKDTLRLLYRLINVAKKYRNYPFSCNEGIFEDIKTLGVDANSAVRSLNFYHDVDLPSPYDIPASSTGAGIFADKQAMKRVIKNSIACIREISTHSNKKTKYGDPRKRKKLHRETDIAMILKDEPLIKIADLAERIGVSPATISRSLVWQQHKSKPSIETFPGAV